MASAAIRRSRSGACGSAASAATSVATPASTASRSASTWGWSNQRNRMLRARSPTTGNRRWAARTRRSSWARARVATSASGAGSVIHRSSRAVITFRSEANRCCARNVRKTASSSSGVRVSSVTP
ncbi:MAG: hypothetical protein R2719_13230 [Micropruina sp.]